MKLFIEKAPSVAALPNLTSVESFEFNTVIKVLTSLAFVAVSATEPLIE